MTSPKYRMIAIDLDGTLLSPEGKVTERAKAAVHQCLSAGLLVCFATGRNWTESKTVLEAVAHYDTAVFVGGAMVVDTKQEVTLHRTMMQPRLAAEVCRELESNGHAVLALQDTGTAGVDYLITADVALNPATSHWMRLTSAKVHRVASLAEYAHEHTIRVGIVAEPDEVARVERELAKTFGERIMMMSIRVPAAGVTVLEVFDPAVNKWEGIMHVARKHDIDPSQIIAIGDDVNDVPMLSRAGLGVAMGNARPEIQAVAKRVIGHNKDEGLAVFLEELVAQHAVAPMTDENKDDAASDAAA
jgi:Cof subfamily protein (haloacid dehalogenase superfamily)